jgi:polynucleotide 5'-kinase involved in rRNA processing
LAERKIALAERVLILGASDRGKTYTLHQLAREAARTHKVALVDGDTGQSELGAPGCVSWAWMSPEGPQRGGTRFVGALSPASAALEHVLALVEVVRLAEAAGANLLFIDTPGYVTGPGARRFLAALVQALTPSRLLVLEREGELGSLPSLLATLSGAELTPLPVADAVVRKSSSVRATRRLTRLARALEGAQEHALALDELTTLGTTLGTGIPVALHLARWAGTALHLNVLYAELAESTLTVFTAGSLRPGWESLVGPVSEHFGVARVRALSLTALEGTCLGLHDSAGRFLGIGRFLGLDSETLRLLLSTTASVERLALLSFGRFRVAADGQFLGELKPGEQ